MIVIMLLDFEANLTLNGSPAEIAIASKVESYYGYGPVYTNKLFQDSDRKIDNISKELDELTFFQLSWEDVGNNSISVSCNMDCVVIMVAWENADRQDNFVSILKDHDWILKSEQQVSWRMVRWGYRVYGRSKAILSKKIKGGAILSFIRPENDLPVSVFVNQGKKYH